MKVKEAVQRASSKKLSPLQQKVFNHLAEHPDEVYTYRDEELAAKLSIKPSTLGFTLWTLHEHDLIAKAKVDAKVYFGSRDAIAELQRQAETTQDDDWFEAAVRTREAIFDKRGYVNVVELLDEVREGR